MKFVLAVVFALVALAAAEPLPGGIIGGVVSPVGIAGIPAIGVAAPLGVAPLGVGIAGPGLIGGWGNSGLLGAGHGKLILG